MTKAHSEEAFEIAIVTSLVDEGGYELRHPDDYDRERALLPKQVIGYVQDTQAKRWAKVAAIHGAKLEGLFLDGLCKTLTQMGSLHVLRHGFGFYGQQFHLCTFAPAHGLNPDIEAQYKANRLSVVRQVPFHPKTTQTLDLALFVNGIPVVTAELKNQMTGQCAVIEAQKQYKFQRDPNAPLFRFKQRALVHFAVDPDEAWMATRLSGASTFFLPFNRGHEDGMGNPPVSGKHRTHYLWEQVWQRDSLLDIIGRFMHLQTEEKTLPSGKKQKKETLIFPRYHQLDCVRRLVAATQEGGSGTNYLIQHSAGSGKSNSIAWLAHRLASLYRDDAKVFDTVVVLTDRNVLDQQLQDTIYQIEHKTGVVVKIQSGGVKSSQLAEALETGAPIIICTIHSFGFVQDKIAGLPDRRYAVIVDEAHSSQSGEMAITVKNVLSEAQIAAKVQEKLDEDDEATPDQVALRSAIARGKQSNLSYYAFTATPKYKTLEVFGHVGPDDKPAPFHLYSMRQAIQEGFILDVLKGYTDYRRYFELMKSVADDPDLDKRKAARAAVRFVNLHHTNIAQKTEIILEHFRHSIRPLLNGQAKAMVVTNSRLQAVRYKKAFDAYLKEKGYKDLRCLVAFSGEVKDPDTPGVSYTEPGMNDGLKESELPETFRGSDHNVLIVAEKYQTGFDQPLLCAMYVDKRLSGIQAVQTLSRLNRTSPGKDQTFVLDFVNDPEEIKKAFLPFYKQARIDERVDPQRLYELKNRLEGYQVFEWSEVEGFGKVFFKLGAEQAVTDHAKLNAWLDPAVDRFMALEEKGQEEFRSALAAYKNLYSFLAQIVPFVDIMLEQLYAFGRMLLKKLPRDSSGAVDLGDEVALKSFVLKKQNDEQDLGLEDGEGGTLKPPGDTGTGKGKGPEVKLSEIIKLINDRFGTEFDAQDLVDGVTDQLVADNTIRQAADANDKENFGYVFTPKLDEALLDRHAKHGEFIDRVFADADMGRMFRSEMLRLVYGRLTEPEGSGSTGAHP
jgi:type I restriction enzyme, R subunit